MSPQSITSINDENLQKRQYGIEISCKIYDSAGFGESVRNHKVSRGNRLIQDKTF